ncbi:uncharacterized protein FIBRA_00523 [Fibroporia radiculosa]|uniref:Mus7/MMS22 family-domain-containing protein n=1 Tax=Fibroporia radiculosa TaxID=599839 RepID=J4H058_9APHY|nr:uncharacterized protein FIBRA_00523 [Fibroporia radiculosa]CCL98524.1 predicted protein [Fibroporia radiculosa]
MESPELVDTSDCDEAEAILAAKPDYWTHATASDLSRDFATSDSQRNVGVASRHEDRSIYSSLFFTRREHAERPPSKRPKILFQRLLLAIGLGTTSQLALAQYRVHLSPLLQSTSLFLEGESLDGFPLGDDLSLPDGGEWEHARFLPPSIDNGRFIPHPQTNHDEHSPQSPSPNASTLLTPKKVTQAGDPLPSTSTGSPVVAYTSDAQPTSPLTPISSPRNHRLWPGETAMPESTHSPPPMQPSSHRAIDSVVFLAQEAEQSSGRYSLRTRQARQRNPYAYDKALYKRQMRANPEAIVKVVSPSRSRPQKERRSKSRGNDSSTEESGDEYVMAEGEEGEETAGVKNVTRGDRRQDSLAESGRTTGQPNQPHGHSSKERQGNTKEKFVQSPRGEIWYPGAFEEFFSSSSSVEGKSPQRATNKGARTKIRAPLKPKPFPMKKRDFAHKHSSGRIESELGSPKRVQPITDVSMGEGSNSDIDLPRWRRHRSSTPSVPERVSLNFPVYDGSANVNDSDLVLDSGTPGPLPPSSTPDMEEQNLTMSGEEHRANVSDIEDDAVRHKRTDAEVIDISDDLSGSESSSSVEGLSAKDRRRMKVLQKMMPRVLIQRHLRDAVAPRPTRPIDRAGSLSDNEDHPLRPGQSRVRIRHLSQKDSVEIRGDTESSDSERSDNVSMSSSESDMDVVVVPHPRSAAKVALDRTGSQTEHALIDVIDETEIGQWVSDKGHYVRHAGDDSQAREGDLIDRMLSRTRVAGSKLRRKRRRKAKSSRHPSGRNLHIITVGARKVSSVPSKATAQERKRKKHCNQGGLFTFASGGERLLSGRTHHRPITIDAEEHVRSSLPHNLLMSKTSLPHPRARTGHKAGSSKAYVNSTLDNYWSAEEDIKQAPRAASSDTLREQAHQDDLDLHRVTLDFDVPVLPSGIPFGPDTYLGKGHLHDLITFLSDAHDISRPTSCSLLGVRLHSEMSTQDFAACLEQVSDRAQDLITRRAPIEGEQVRQWRILLHSLNSHMVWLFRAAEDDDYVALSSAMDRQVGRLRAVVEEPTEVIPEDEVPYLLVYEIHWFTLEAAFRMFVCHRRRHGQLCDVSLLRQRLRVLIRQLWDFGFRNLLDPFNGADENALPDESMSRRVSELWVCIIHLINAGATTLQDSLDQPSEIISFWRTYTDFVREAIAPRRDISELVISESVWRSIFTLCSLSQFSVQGITTSLPRLGASWELVMIALDRIRLGVDLVVDAKLSKRSLQKRDEYIRLMVARCLVLNRKWRWTLDDAWILFNRLLDIFKSRRFANLLDEPSDFPSFLRHSNLQLLSENKRSDTAFTLFLKLVVQAANDNRTQADQPGQIPPRVKKLLSLCVPVGSVPFTKVTPPTKHELSMLYNRFSAVAVALYLEPTTANLKFRLANARRYVNFHDTDNETRRACIRGLMHFAILLQHLSLPLDELLDWLAEMTSCLIDEHQDPQSAGYSKSWIVVSIQMLLGCVRRIIETPLMGSMQNKLQYPEPALLRGPWVTRVLATTSNLTGIATTRIEIRKLVQAFLDARAAVLPKPARPRVPHVHAEESQESQEEFAMFDQLDYNDPELLAALGEPGEGSTFQENKNKDQIVSELIDSQISPAIYRLVCKYFNDLTDQGSLEPYSQEADKWVDCWVGCANVVVQNGRRDWSLYLTLGPQSWERIIDSSWRRRVGLRFMLMLLRLDPQAYTTYKDRFIDVLLESMVSPKVTIEHEYMALLFSIDYLRHPLLADIICERDEATGDYQISRLHFLERRATFLHKIFENLASLLLREAQGELDLTRQNQTCVGSVVIMLSTMQDNHQLLNERSAELQNYVSLCQEVFGDLSQFAILKNNPRLLSLITWANGLKQ